MANLSDQIESAKSTLTGPLPTPPEMSGKQADPNELLSRLNWGEPGLTIVDVRDREAFNNGAYHRCGTHSHGANFPDSAEPLLEYERDLYIYGDNAGTASESSQPVSSGWL